MDEAPIRRAHTPGGYYLSRQPHMLYCQLVQGRPADFPALGACVAAILSITAQRDNPVLVVCCCGTLLQRNNMVRLQSACAYFSIYKAPAAQSPVALVYFGAYLLPAVAVAHAGLRCALRLAPRSCRADVAHRVHPPAPFTACLHCLPFFVLASMSSSRPAPIVHRRTHSAAVHRPAHLPAAFATGTACRRLALSLPYAFLKQKEGSRSRPLSDYFFFVNLLTAPAASTTSTAAPRNPTTAPTIAAPKCAPTINA